MREVCAILPVPCTQHGAPVACHHVLNDKSQNWLNDMDVHVTSYCFRTTQSDRNTTRQHRRRSLTTWAVFAKQNGCSLYATNARGGKISHPFNLEGIDEFDSHVRVRPLPRVRLCFRRTRCERRRTSNYHPWLISCCVRCCEAYAVSVSWPPYLQNVVHEERCCARTSSLRAVVAFIFNFQFVGRASCLRWLLSRFQMTRNEQGGGLLVFHIYFCICVLLSLSFSFSF